MSNAIPWPVAKDCGRIYAEKQFKNYLTLEPHILLLKEM
jgi:hypothetical protein